MTTQINAHQKTLIDGYKSEALEFLSQAEQAMQQYKDIVSAAHEVTKVSKKWIGKAFKAAYQDKVKAISEEAEVIEFLNS